MAALAAALAYVARRFRTRAVSFCREAISGDRPFGGAVAALLGAGLKRHADFAQAGEHEAPYEFGGGSMFEPRRSGDGLDKAIGRPERHILCKVGAGLDKAAHSSCSQIRYRYV